MVEHYYHIFEHSPQSMLITDESGLIRDLNQAAMDLLCNALSLCSSQVAPAQHDRATRNGQSKGTNLPSNVTPQPQEATLELTQSRSRYVSSNDHIVAEQDHLAHVLLDEPQFEKSDLVGRSLFSFVSPKFSATFEDYLAKVSNPSTSRQGHMSLWLDTLVGIQRWVQFSAQSILLENQSPGIAWVLVDITESLQTESSLTQQINEANESYNRVQQINEQLEATVQAKNSQVLKATEFESALKRITDKVRDSLDESKILQTVVKELSIVLRLGGCNTALYDLQKGTSTISYEYTNFISAYRGKVAQMDNFPEIYNQLKQGHYFQFCSLIPNPERGHVSLLACPIFVDAEREAPSNPSISNEQTLAEPHSPSDREQVLGDLWLIDRKSHVFNEFEIRLVQQVANQCAIAIRQARLYKAAQAQVHELEKLNRLKDEFLSTVSHELRTPISNVKMAIHMLKNAPTEEKRQQYLKILEAESQREADLIDDLLDLQKLEVSRYPIAARTLSIRPWLESIIQPFQSRMESHQQLFTLHCANSVSTLNTDFSILERVVGELLNNACKYTPSGHHIQVEVYEEKGAIEGSLNPAMVFQISNEATIAEEELPHIFNKFYRIPHSDPWKQGGTGLGLALVEKLVAQIDGSIKATSAEGWTHFTVVIANQ